MQKVVQISCGWRHTLAVTDRQNVFSWGRGTSGQLGHGDSIDRNTPKVIEALNADGCGFKLMESSKLESSTGKIWVSPSERYALVPDESVKGRPAVSAENSGGDTSVPENDVQQF